MRRAVLLLLCVACAAAAGCGSAEPKPQRPGLSRAAERKLAAAPGALGAHYREAGRLLDGGADAFRKRLDRLRGRPIVVNKWASWCPPCRAEFPFFQAQAAKRGLRVAFVGVDAQDSKGAARSFLRRFPVPYPHFEDPKLEIAATFDAVQAFPATAFYDRRGKLVFVHQGGYATERKLQQDIERYAR